MNNNDIIFIITDIILIILNTYFVITKTGHWQFNFAAAICLTISVSLIIAKNILNKKGRK